MSPEALEGRMNLLDTESFKQIDIFALALLIWEVSNRCCIFEGMIMYGLSSSQRDQLYHSL